MRALVTGASGFVGQWLVERLLEEGVQVRVLRRKSRSADVDSRLETFWGDITDAEAVNNACRQVHTVFHLAGHVGYSRAERDLMERVNIEGTRNIVNAVVQSQVTRLVHMSSVVTIGASLDGSQILNEDSIYNLEPYNLGYFETKRAAELLVLEAVKSGLIDAVIVNPSTIYGPGDATKGSRKTQVKVAKGRFPFFTNGGASIIAIEDVIEATVTAWRKGRTGERYILSGENLTIQQLFSTIAAAAGVPAPRFALPNLAVRILGQVGDALEAIGRKGPINSENAWVATMYHWYDHAKARRELGLQPKPAALAIGQSVEWMKKHGLLEGK